MPDTRKLNEFLDLDDEDDQVDVGYDSDAQQESRGAAVGRSTKRRRLSNESDNDAPTDEGDAESGDDRFVTALDMQSDEEAGADPADSETTLKALASRPNKDLVPLTAKQFEASQKAVKKTGVIYLSRIPPFMKPQAVKHYFTAYGPTERVFLTPEDAPARTQRLRNGGNKKTFYVDGWVEFKNKKDAKMVADNLNGNIIGGKKGSYYHDDIWNIKYLKGFKWHHLTEQIANENAEHAARLRAELARTRKENRDFVRDVERGKMLQTKRAKKAKKEGVTADEVDAGQPAMKFRQNLVKAGRDRDKIKVDQPESTARVLSKLF